MLVNEQTKQGLTDREVTARTGWLQQTFSRWKMGSLPRQHMFASIGSFLGISSEAVAELVEEASASTGNTKLAAAYGGVKIYGRVTDRKAGKYVFEAFNQGRKRIPEGRYAILVDTKVMEPALLVGTKAWVDPAVWPSVGNEVMVHAKGGVAWLGRLVSLADALATIEAGGGQMTIRDVEAVHVIVLSERVAK
ncbi:XRE family transcriptional regulator [Rhizobium laguerreae]|uniref:XRE family transcriptional regulator n=1 Tax=Rhizobium laguerreae TaxID=1076926 RepID=UPI0014790F07|nr:XRE family transcriptional regulator [Rhizobium laguerreae]NNH56956.1 XRE family transcriptional regulator [Rhizobium laguerreae]